MTTMSTSHASVNDGAAQLAALQAELDKAKPLAALGMMAGDMAHDFNTLLGVIIANLDLLAEHLKGDANSAVLADEALTAALRGAEMSAKLLGAARGHAAAMPKTDAKPLASPPETPAFGGTETILAVDDNPEMRRAVVRQLTDLGYRVLEAADGPAALMILNSESVDLLFTDVVMPGGMSGFDLARLVLSRRPTMKALITSGFPELVPDGDSVTAGKLRRLTKPYRKDELAMAVRDVLAG